MKFVIIINEQNKNKKIHEAEENSGNRYEDPIQDLSLTLYDCSSTVNTQFRRKGVTKRNLPFLSR